MPPPTGTVQVFCDSSAIQSAVMIGDVVRYHLSGRLQFTKGWNSAWLTERRSESPAKLQICCASRPYTQSPSIRSTTALGPALYLPLPSRSSEAVSNRTTGPTPQVHPF